METHKQFYRFLLSLQRISENANLERIPKESRKNPEGIPKERGKTKTGNKENYGKNNTYQHHQGHQRQVWEKCRFLFRHQHIERQNTHLTTPPANPSASYRKAKGAAYKIRRSTCRCHCMAQRQQTQRVERTKRNQSLSACAVAET